MGTNQPDEAKVREKLAEKMELISKVRQLQAEMTKVNVELAKAGASVDQLKCW